MEVFRIHKTPNKRKLAVPLELLQRGQREASTPASQRKSATGNCPSQSSAARSKLCCSRDLEASPMWCFRSPQEVGSSGRVVGRGEEFRWVWTTRSGWTRPRSASIPVLSSERGRKSVIRGADTRVEVAATTSIRDESQQIDQRLALLPPSFDEAVDITLSQANAVPGQEVCAADWQPGTFCSASWGRMATAKRLGAGVRNVKEGGALTVLVGLAAKFLLAASLSSFGHTHCHTADQTRARRAAGERETDTTLTARPPGIREQIFCHDVLSPDERHRGSPPRRGKKVGFDARATASPVECACHCPCCLPQTCPQVLHLPQISAKEARARCSR